MSVDARRRDAQSMEVSVSFGSVHANEVRAGALRQLAACSSAVGEVTKRVRDAAEDERRRLEALAARCSAAMARLDVLERGGAKAATLIESMARYPRLADGGGGGGRPTAGPGLAAEMRPLFDNVYSDIEGMDDSLQAICRAMDATLGLEYANIVSKTTGIEALNGECEDNSAATVGSASGRPRAGSTIEWSDDRGDGAMEIFKFSTSERLNSTQETVMNIHGLGKPPSTLRSVSDLLLFNTGKNVYEKHDPALDALNNYDEEDEDGGASGEARRTDSDADMLSDAPMSVIDGDSLPMVGVNEIGFKPTLGPVPELQLPSDLPELSMAADISWSGDDDLGSTGNIAPSAMAEALPDLDMGPSTSNGGPAADESLQKGTLPTDTAGHVQETNQGPAGDQASLPPPPPPPPLPPPPPPPPASASTSASRDGGDVPLPAPPGQGTDREALLDQIRNPGSVLKKVSKPEDSEGDGAGAPVESRPPAPMDPHSALMNAVLSKKTLRKTNAEDGQQEEGGSTKQPRDSRPAPSSDPHSDLMSAIKNRASISLKPATEASRSQRSQSLPPEKADIMSQLAGDLAKRRVSIATGGSSAEDEKPGGAGDGGIMGLSQYLASVDEEDNSSDDDDWDD